MTLQFTKIALASDDDAEVIVFDLRMPPGEPNTMSKSTQQASGQGAANSERLA
ncbi:MAG: hypothetical protein ABIT16_00905 [Croceibacterium sp.]